MFPRTPRTTIPRSHETPLNPPKTPLPGKSAGALATFLTQPTDVLRCHLQIDHQRGFSNFRAHISERGIFRALYIDGLPPRITRRSLVSAINWSVFEAAKNYYNSLN